MDEQPWEHSEKAPDVASKPKSQAPGTWVFFLVKSVSFGGAYDLFVLFATRVPVLLNL